MKRKLILSLSVLLVLVFLSVGLTFCLDFWTQAWMKDTDSLKAEILKISQKKHAFENIDQFLAAESSTYQKVMDSAFALPLNRLQARQILHQAAEVAYIDLIKFKLFPKTDLSPEYATTLIEIHFKATLDTDVYHFIQDLEEKMPGLILPQSLTLKRSNQEVEGVFIFQTVTAKGFQS